MFRTLAIAVFAVGLPGCAPQAGNEAGNSTVEALGPKQAFDLRDNDPRCVEGAEAPGGTWTSVINDERTAVTIAEHYLAANFAEIAPPSICRLEARLSHGVWHVGGLPPPDSIGGCLSIEICQRNGRVLRMWGEQ